ncbi:MAG: putative sugar O-methyltransferase [Sphingorhabdus sp.]|uniref:putative sugar O-methyltransferase n=1 Tax=Sphingorhabdus sp. TaxID=1902408 RepID=UPI0025ECAD24|nr:putative sugar O-methyltransferase [Sphingorhabdus sp.]MCO4090765.1 putative sugar O-methyltransferase [Sphingorhabdus sp.]
MVKTYRYWDAEFKRDPLYEIAAVQKGLLPRPTSSTRSKIERTQVAQRIIDAYSLTAKDHSKQNDLYKVSNEWVPIYEKPLTKLLDVLRQGDAEGLRDLLDNFFRNSISTGLIGMPVDMEKVYFKNAPSKLALKRMLIDAVYRYRLLEKLLPNVTTRDLHIENFGNPYGIWVGQDFVRSGSDYQYYYAHVASSLVASNEQRSVVAELGGGIGGFAYYLNKIMPNNLAYINLDLPEILCISSYQLMNLFPEKKFLLYGDEPNINIDTIKRYDIALLPSFVIQDLEDNSVDLFFNSYSLAEMDESTIENYTKHISRTTRQAILHVNHVANALVGADKFQFDKNKFQIEYRKKAEWNLGRDLNCDEYEFLLKRRNEYQI